MPINVQSPRWIEICASYNGVMYHGDASAYAQSNQRCSDEFVVNRLVVRYPRIAPPAGVPLPEVPFPDAPFQDCTGKKGTLGCAERVDSAIFRAATDRLAGKAATTATTATTV